ncbi:DUF3060 domain-containing protein [Duganella sp. FT94W]|uniref:DUF3060 domain-containing protein n=1 Tax=Duganella lactea TaxID=2692173 RepID=A0ABW9V6B4_9BURK|nr:DUF3060 domain-containing protein [Duganella lactea]MYM34212.1 DUF3060 domain-containing protein [Duganella lactea]
MRVLKMIAAAGVVGLLAQGAMADDAVGEINVGKDKIEISGNGYVRTFPCEGRHVIIAGTQHNITLTGTCASLEMNGAENKVALTLAPKAVMVVAGIQQTVIWRSTGEPQQRISGVGHKIQRS